MIVIVALVGIGAVALAYVLLRASGRSRRLAEIYKVGEGLGLSFSPAEEPHELDLPFSLFQLGAKRRVTAELRGEHAGEPLRLFDYQYASPGGRYGSAFRFTCALSTLPVASPPFALRPVGPVERVTHRRHRDEVATDSDAFNRRYRVRCDDVHFASSLLDAGMIDWLLRAPKFFALELCESRVLVVRRAAKPSGWPDLAATLEQFRAHVPESVWSAYPPG